MNVLPGLFEVKANVALVAFVGSRGAIVGSIVATGLVKSIVQLWDAATLSFPARSAP